MKVNWYLLFSNIFVWTILGVIIFEEILPMLVFVFFGGVCGGFIFAGKKKGKDCKQITKY